MPKAEASFSLPLPPDDALSICRRVISERGWSLKELGERRVVARVATTIWLYPQTIHIELEDREGGTQVHIRGKSWDRPVIQKTVAALYETLEFEARQSR
jgi:hypothetical protein